MSFNSITFLFWFLPVFLIVYYISKPSIKSILLLIASLFVYSWGNTVSLCFLIGFTILTYFLGILIEEHPNCLSLAVVLDVAFLCLFKYTNAGAEAGILSGLPLGISFYTFHAISYEADIANHTVKAAKNPLKLALYICMFPKVIMGPIVRYKDIDEALDCPITNPKKTADGMFKFCIGLAKKTLIAASLAGVTGTCWADAANSVASAWLGITAFTLQLYYDFSGYSDMPIGLGKMLGFDFKENFIYPYEAQTLSDFWRRWHASLGEWFKTYVYIPLGGSKLNENRTYLNMLVVWVLTGLWHGVGFNFLCWGLFLFVFSALEKKFNTNRLPRPLGIFLTDFIVMIGWVFFNSASAYDAISYIGYMFGNASALSSGISDVYFYDNFPTMLIAAVGACSFPSLCAKQIFKDGDDDTAISTVAKCVFILALLIASTVYMVSAGYTPFIYQNF